MGTRLYQLLASDLPNGFVQALIDHIPLVYGEAFDSVKHDPRFGEPEVRYMHGYTRRALIQVALRKIGAANGMTVEMRRAEGVGGPEHVIVSCGRFCFTACHIPTPYSFPKESTHREQYSLINEHVAQGQLFSVQSEPENADIYGVIIHSESHGDKGKLGTLSIGFPNETCDDWIEEPIALIDLADAQKKLSEATKEAEQAAKPKWKADKKEEKPQGA